MKKRAIIIFVVALVSTIILTALELYQPLSYLRLQNLYRDTFARIGRKAPPNPNLVFLAIDSASAGLDLKTDLEQLYGLGSSDSNETRALRLMSKEWPWSREVHALVLNRLVQAGAKAVLFDLIFPTASEGDEAFRMALDQHRDRVVIGRNFISETTAERRTTVLTPLPVTLIPETVPSDDRVAYVNLWADADEITRHARFRVTSDLLQDSPEQQDSEVFLSLGARGLIKAGYAQSVPSDLDVHAFRYTNWPRLGFPPHSIFEIFIPEYWEHNYQSGEFFRDKIVIVGAEGNWAHDEHATPFGLMPGPEIHLNAINAALHGEFIREGTLGLIAILTLVSGAIAIALTLAVRSPWLRLAALLIISASGIWAGLTAYNRLSFCVILVAPLLELNVTGFLGLFSDLVRERLEKNHVRRTLERYVSKNVVLQLLDEPTAYANSLGGVVRPVTILFSDIRGYSGVSARTDPQALVSQLNEYLTAMVECVFGLGGTLDKFIGDAVMAVWGNTQSNGIRNDATNAVRAALAMQTELKRLNKAWQTRGLPQLRIGIGINHGEVVVGNIGSPRRMEFTVIGDAVNLTWKLQELTKDLGAELIVSKNVSALVVEEFDLRALGSATINGWPRPIDIFEVSGAIDLPAKASNSAGYLQ